MYLTTNIPHQYLFPPPNNENAVPDHYYSSSEGSDAQSCVAPATAEAFISDGSPNSGIAHLAANDEPYMPPRPHATTTTTANPSPLHYTLPPDYVASHIGHSISRDQFRDYAGAYDTHTGSYPPQYQHRNTYQQQAPPEDFPYWDDPPYIPPGFTPPPPLALQARSQYTRILPANPPPPPPPPSAPSHTVIPPQSAYGSPSSPSSSESSVASFGQSYAPRHHQYHHHQHHHHQQHHHHHSLQHQHHQYHQHTSSFSPSPSAIPIQEGGSHASVSPIPVEAHIPPPSLESSHQHQQQHQHEFSQSPIPEPSKGNEEEEQEEIPRSRQWHETDKYLRNQIGIPEGTRVDLWALPDPAPGQKPQQPLPILVKLAIHGCDKGMLTLQEIYQTLEERFEYFARLKSSAWKNSIRHNLSLNQVFRSCDRPITEPGKGRYWSVDISKGEGYKRERRRKRRNAAPYNGTRDLPGGVGNQLNNTNNNSGSQVDSSDGDQDMEDGGGGTASMSESVTLKAVVAPTVMGKKVRGIGGRRGPYTKITVAPQPSIPGTTGLTPGPASTSSVSPTLPTPTAMAYNPNPNSGMGAESASAAAAASSSSASIQVPNAMHDGINIVDGVIDPSSSSSSGPQHHHQRPPAAAAAAVAPQYYQPAYGFTRAAMPTFGQPSLTAPATFFSSPSPTRPMGYQTTTTMEGMMMNPNPILISSDSGSDSENGRRMMGI